MATLERWEPEDNQFWEQTGKKVAWRTLTVTTIALVLSFTTWFMMSAIVVRLPNIGFTFDTMQLFWLAAMPGLAGGSLRIIHTFLIPIFGTRNVISWSTIIKLVPVIGIGIAVTDISTPFWVFLIFAFTAGFGGGDFSSYMPSTSIFFPKRLQGTALGIQAGIGNFGVSVTQFLTPWIIGFAALGTIVGGPQILTKGDATSSIWLQNASYVYAPLLVLVAILSWTMLKRVPVKASFKEQLDIFKNKHTWFCTVTYVMTFGSFSGLSAAFPLLIKTTYGGFPDSPDPLTYAFLGPLVGSLARVVAGPFTDKWGGAILTHITGLVLIVGAVVLAAGGYLTPESMDSFPAFVVIMLVMFTVSGVGNASTFRQFPIIFSHSSRQGAGVIGWTAAIAAYGPFIFSSLIGVTITYAGSPTMFFYGIAVYYVLATAINWWYYTRKGCEKPS
jgi:NNP family nitrate/nitrite transporter-like MFS transporter